MHRRSLIKYYMKRTRDIASANIFTSTNTWERRKQSLIRGLRFSTVMIKPRVHKFIKRRIYVYTAKSWSTRTGMQKMHLEIVSSFFFRPSCCAFSLICFNAVIIPLISLSNFTRVYEFIKFQKTLQKINSDEWKWMHTLRSQHRILPRRRRLAFCSPISEFPAPKLSSLRSILMLTFPYRSGKLNCENFRARVCVCFVGMRERIQNGFEQIFIVLLALKLSGLMSLVKLTELLFSLK